MDFLKRTKFPKFDASVVIAAHLKGWFVIIPIPEFQLHHHLSIWARLTISPQDPNLVLALTIFQQVEVDQPMRISHPVDECDFLLLVY